MSSEQGHLYWMPKKKLRCKEFIDVPFVESFDAKDSDQMVRETHCEILQEVSYW